LSTQFRDRPGVACARVDDRDMRIVILGAGFGGLELAAALSGEFGDALDLTLVDSGEGFVFGFSKLDVMFGKAEPSSVVHRYDDLSLPGVRFVRARVQSIDPKTRQVETTSGLLDADVLVVALGADLDPAATPGLVDGGHEFYTVAGAFALRDAIRDFGGGDVVVGVTSTPFKCPPAPSETALLMHDFLRGRGLLASSEVTLVMPLPTPVPPSPAASEALLAAFDERGIRWRPNRLVAALDPARRVAILDDGGELGYDLFLGIPVHRAPQVVVESGLTVDGWVPVDPGTLATSFPGVYAVGDVASVGTPKAGVFAEGQAAIVAAHIAAQLRGDTTSAAYDGRGVCYVEFGHGAVAKVDVTFRPDTAPFGALEGPSPELAADKEEFGASRIRRWFG
jgi:sulfide:quinone oxidoreductase